MDLKDGLFLGPGEMVHLRLHNRHAAGRYSLGLAGIEFVSHADVKGAGDHSYVLDRGVGVRRNFEVRWELIPILSKSDSLGIPKSAAK